MKRFPAVMTLVTAGIFAMSGCATTPAPGAPGIITCLAFGSSQLTSPGKRIDLNHFSAQLPDDAERWCIGGTGTSLLAIYTHPLLGQYVEKPDSRMAINVVTLMAMELAHGSAQFETTIALQNFVEEWIDQGFGVEATGADMKVMHRRVQDFTVKRANVTPEPRPQAHCVRFEYQMEERGNPLAPSTTLIQDVYGLVCQHPRIPSNIVVMSLAEQYAEGNQINPGLFPQLQRDAALTFFDSLKFIDPDDRPKSTGESVKATGTPVTKMDHVLKFRGFSIQRPTDDRWRLHSDNQKPHIASFYFAPLSPTHSFNATVQIRGLPADFATKPEFKEFVDTKLREHGSRFEELSFISTLTELSGEWAVNYELRYLDKHPVNSSTPLFMTIKGFMYLHPYWKKSVIDAFYSERGTAAELDGTLDPVGQELIDGTSPEKS